MSVINRVLRDLDGQAAAAPLPAGVRSVPAAARPRRRLGWLLVLPGVAAAVYLAWPRPAAPPAPQPAAPVTAPSSLIPSPSPGVGRESFPSPSGRGAGVREPGPTTAAAQARPLAPSLAMARVLVPPAAVAPAAPEPARPQVVKAAHPPSPREQAEAAYARALRLMEAGRARDALAQAGEALALDPGHVGARQVAVTLALEAGERAQAEDWLREGAAAHPAEAWFARGLAQLHLQGGDPGRAAEALQAGLAGADADYHGLYAGVLAKLGRFDAAAAEYRAALAGQPGQGTWWLGLGLALERAGRRADAAAAYARAAQARLAPELAEFVARKRAELN